jgi:predicted HicB family RNase H-like nuclease
MKALTIRVEDSLHKKLKIKMVEEETTLQDYILRLIKKDLECKENK